MKNFGFALAFVAGAACSVATAQSLVQSKAVKQISNETVETAQRAAFRPTRTATRLTTGQTIPGGGFGTRATTVVYDTFSNKSVTIAGTPFTGRSADFNLSWADQADYRNGTGSGSAYIRGLWDAANAATVPAFPANNGFAASLSGAVRTDILFDGWDAQDAVWPGGDTLVAKGLKQLDYALAFRNSKTGAVEEPRVVNMLFFNLDPVDPTVGIVEGGVQLTYTLPVGFAGFFDDTFDFTTFGALDPIQGIDGDLMYDFPNTITVVAACPADFNGDTFVDDTDFVIFATNYDLFSVPPADPACDLNNDGFVDDTDFVIFASAYDQFTCPSGGGTVVADGVGVMYSGGRHIWRFPGFTVQGRQGTTSTTAFPLPEELLSVGASDGADFPVRSWGFVNSVGSDADPNFDGQPGISYVDIYNTATGFTNWWYQLGTTTQYAPPSGSTDYIGIAGETPRRITVEN